MAWTGATEFGLLHLFELPSVLEMLAAIIILDFTAQYFAHWLMHRVKFLWRFHVVHHSDTKVDATTGTRLHPGDFFVRECVALIALTLTGAPLAYYVVYRITTIFFTFVTHANISLPRWLDASLSFVFVTPNMHKFHHHFERPWTDKNYGGSYRYGIGYSGHSYMVILTPLFTALTSPIQAWTNTCFTR